MSRKSQSLFACLACSLVLLLVCQGGAEIVPNNKLATIRGGAGNCSDLVGTAQCSQQSGNATCAPWLGFNGTVTGGTQCQNQNGVMTCPANAQQITATNPPTCIDNQVSGYNSCGAAVKQNCSTTYTCTGCQLWQQNGLWYCKQGAGKATGTAMVAPGQGDYNCTTPGG
jgi:hypothetical protein